MRAAIDIGTNTVLLLVTNLQQNHLQVVHEQQKVPRLGKGVDSRKNLADESIDRVISNIKDYQEYLTKHYPKVETIDVTATSAVRDARNQDYFIKKVKEETGLDVQVLNGLEEAEYTYHGALSVLRKTGGSHPNVVIDIGGGSTEVIAGNEESVWDLHSFNMGCVRFTERYLRGNDTTLEKEEKCRDAIKQMLRDYKFEIPKHSSLIGVAGTVTSLAYMEMDLESYKPELINGTDIKKTILKKWIKKVQDLTSQELINRYPLVMEGRADIYLAGLLILDEFMHLYKFEELTVSTGGIRHGTVLKKRNE